MWEFLFKIGIGIIDWLFETKRIKEKRRREFYSFFRAWERRDNTASKLQSDVRGQLEEDK